ncbi:zinc finger BED domain-containing protein RICESLEEPER 2-like [Rosa rugosa]|uniref:zinc finger BED domain-containing protein RICESLEEPER 2-like n=1 Tax=Rosa rugosa TaxID=74645 RepID=UPI002B412F8E|nr:zinc finger BED domain-containing protein RICESLEEPER 2-like [Rosa rugosa]
MARGKKIARPRSDASGLEDSSTATSPAFPAQLEATSQPEAANQPNPTLEVGQVAASQPAATASQPSGSEAAASVGEAPSEKSGIKRSFVWDHFKEYDKIEHAKDADGKDIQIVHKRAHCIYCPRGKVGDFAVDSSKNGTSGMIRHINMNCRYYPPNMDKSQKNLVGDKFKGNRLTTVTYSQDDYLEACVEMVVIDELPFSFVEKKGFNRFCVKVCPLFDVPSRRKLCRTFLSMYDTSKKDLRKTLRKYRLSLTTDTWTSVQNVNYMVLTAHFIDIDWKMHKRVINFCVTQNHQGSSIGKLIESCLVHWGIEKIMCITVDNASVNKSALEWLVSKMNKFASYQQILSGKYMHVRCTSHITNLIVGHGLKRLQKSVLAIRNAVKFVRSSANRLDIFKKTMEREKLPCKGLVCLDVPTRWNSTYLMLEAALKFKKAFTLMAEDEDSNFANYFKEPDEEYDEDGNLVPSKNKRNMVGPPEVGDWEKAEVFVEFLRVFYDVTLRVGASLHPTVHTTFHDVITMEKNIENMFLAPEIASGSETQKILMDMAANMRSRWLKYYGSFHEINHMIIIGLVLDARFKLKNVTHIFQTEGLDDDEVQRRTLEIKTLLLALYDQMEVDTCKGSNLQALRLAQLQVEAAEEELEASCSIIGRRLLKKCSEAVVAHEVDQYLDAPLDPTDDEDCFDILC